MTYMTHFGVEYSEEKSVGLTELDGFLKNGWKVVALAYFVSDPSSMSITIAKPTM